MFQAINDALHATMRSDPNSLLFGQDVAFGGVFRCTLGLLQAFGSSRVFNTPLTESGIIGLACGLAANQAHYALPEIQFSDYIYPALDQLCNEVAKYRYRSGAQFDCGRMVIRAPWGAVGHGGLYHSQSPEAIFAGVAGLKMVVPRGPWQAKGLLLAAVRDPDPVIFFEPKVLYRQAAGEVPIDPYISPMGKADVMRTGSDVTIISWGSLLYMIDRVIGEQEVSADLVDLQTLVPWDVETVSRSVHKTGRVIIVHEAPLTGGFGAELAASLQSRCWSALRAPIERVAGWDTPFPLAFERFYLPDEKRLLAAIARVMSK